MGVAAALNSLMPLPDGEPFDGETIRADGWVYRDLDRMTPDAWDELHCVIGADNIRFMTWANYGKSVRGQIWISPAGMDNLRAVLTKSKYE